MRGGFARAVDKTDEGRIGADMDDVAEDGQVGNTGCTDGTDEADRFKA